MGFDGPSFGGRGGGRRWSLADHTERVILEGLKRNLSHFLSQVHEIASKRTDLGPITRAERSYAASHCAVVVNVHGHDSRPLRVNGRLHALGDEWGRGGRSAKSFGHGEGDVLFGVPIHEPLQFNEKMRSSASWSEMRCRER